MNPETLANLSPEQRRALLKQLMAQRAAQQEIPLSLNQQRLFFVAQMQGDNPAYNMVHAYRLRGLLDEAALRSACDTLSARHEVLRTTFGERNGRPYQKVHAQLAPEWTVRDLSRLPEEARLAEAHRLTRVDNRRPFALGEGPLWRNLLCRLAEDDHVLVIGMHHLITDVGSYAVFNRELAAAYEAALRGEAPRLPAPPMQYQAFVAWDTRADRDFGEGAAYWARRLAGMAVTTLPLERPRPSVPSLEGRAYSFALDRGAVARLGDLAREAGVSMPLAWLAVFQCVLHRYTEATDINCATPVANRGRAEALDMIGFFVNTHVMRTDFGGRPPFHEVLRRIKETGEGIYHHGEVPFDQIAKRLFSDAEGGRRPLYQLMFQRGTLPVPSLPGLLAEPVFEMDFGTVRSDLECYIGDTAGGGNGILVYDTALFSEAGMADLARHFNTLAAHLTATPDVPVAALPLLDAAERHALIYACNATAKDVHTERLMHALFEARAAEHPDAPAVVCGAESVDYGTLNRRANQLAHHLRARGLRPRDRVGICLNRGVSMAVGVLAVLKAGGAYVPMDIDFPADRMAFILDDCAAALWLTHAVHAARVATPVPAVDPEDPCLASLPDHDPVPVCDAHDTAYIIFTSGSTGRPKGVLVRHHTVINLIDWVNQTYAVGPGDRLLFTTSLCFDLSVYDLFGILAAGATVVVADDAAVKDPVALAGLLLEGGISFWDSAPAALMQLVPFFPPRGAGSRRLRLVFLSGDWVPLSLPPTLKACFPAVHVTALGGATEATIWSNYFDVETVHPDWQSIPYGYPIQNARYLILDTHLAPAPIGCPGDLFIAGPCLSYGYVNRPARTAWHFVPDPYTEEPGAFMYRTGDRARRRREGWMEFLGRLDAQVKIHGYRIELGEVAAQLRDLPGVREAVVLARALRADDTRLVAYVQPAPDAQLGAEDLAAAVAKRLPHYMLPAAYVFLDSWPVTANGKLDHKALPLPEREVAEATAAALQGEAEHRIAAVWAEVLGLEQIGAHDNFFDLGGHSLNAAAAVARLREQFGEAVSLRALFAHESLRAFAQAVTADEATAADTIARQEPPCDRLSFAQERIWYLQQLAPESVAYHIPFAARLQGSLNFAWLMQAFDVVTARHEQLRAVFPMGADGPRVRVLPPGSHRLTYRDLTEEAGDAAAWDAAAVDAAAMAFVQETYDRPFDLTREPGFRMALLKTAPDTHYLTLCLHHIVGDGHTVDNLTRGFNAVLAAFAAGTEPELPELPIRYSDYVAWQRDPARAAEQADHLAWWCDRLRGEPPVPALPAAFPRPAEFRFRGADHVFTLPIALMRRVHAAAAAEHVTPFMYLMTALDVLIARYSGLDDIWIGSPITNRARLETEPLVGLLFNTLVFRVDVGGNPDVRTLLARVRRTATDAYAHGDVPFEHLLDTLRPGRDLSHSPLFQVMFNLLHAPITDLSVPGTRLERLFPVNRGAKLDLIFDLEDMPAGHDGIGLRGRLEYNTDLFDDACMARMAGHFTHLLTQMVAHPEQRVTDLALLSPAEAERVLHTWNDTVHAFRPECLHTAFEAAAARMGDAPAAEHDGSVCSYAQLAARADRLARYLQERGVARGERVGVLLARGLDMPAALLAVLKLGAVYVPMDPRYPADRVRTILTDIDARFMLTQTPLAALAQGAHVTAVCLDTLDLAHVSAAAVARVVDVDQPAYIIFTSGSTGKPKGVVVQHRPVANLIQWVNGTFAVGPDDRLLFTTSLCFDLSVYDIFGILAAGGVVHMPCEHQLEEPAALAELLGSARITFWDSAPAALARLAPLLPAQGSPHLRLVFLSGDWIPLSLPPLLQRTFPNVRVISLGGATEAVIWSNVYPVTALRPEWRSVPYGRPIHNARYYILDARLHPLPVHTAGDLYIGGPVLSMGYVGRPGLTAERYLPDPHGRTPGAVMYRTGDRAQFYADGNIEFLGRLDAQVKVRGFRIELGEIEAVLGTHDTVAEAVVLARPGAAGDRVLVAYVRPHEGASADVDALRAHLRSKLPDYMVPTHLVTLDVWPVTANGKLDRAALSDPLAEAPTDTYSAPTSELQEKLCAIWAEVLQVDRVGIDDNFFAMGGDSISSIRVIARARELGLEISARRFFQQQSIRALTEAPEAPEAEAEAGAAPEPAADDGALGEAQRGLYFAAVADPESTAYNVEFGLRLHGALDEAALVRALETLVARHDSLRTTFVEEGGTPRRRIGAAYRPTLQRRDLRGLDAAAVTEVLRRDMAAPFRIAEEPLFRVWLYQTNEDTHLSATNGDTHLPETNGDTHFSNGDTHYSGPNGDTHFSNEDTHLPETNGDTHFSNEDTHLSGKTNRDTHLPATAGSGPNGGPNGDTHLPAIRDTHLSAATNGDTHLSSKGKQTGTPTFRQPPGQEQTGTPTFRMRTPTLDQTGDQQQTGTPTFRQPPGQTGTPTFHRQTGTPIFREKQTGQTAPGSNEGSNEDTHLSATTNGDTHLSPTNRDTHLSPNGGSNGDTHLLVWVFHHLIVDAASLQVLLREAAFLYANPEAALPAAPGYGAAVARRVAWLGSAEARAQEAFWARALVDAPAVNTFLHDRRAAASGRGTVLVRPFDAAAYADLCALASARGVTRFAVLAAAFYLVIRRRVGRADLVLGTDVANRNLPETADLVGLLVNQLPLRLDADAEDTFAALVAASSAHMAAVLAHQDLPFDRILAAARPPREAGYPPLVQIKLGLHPLRRQPTWPGLDTAPFAVPRRTAQLDLNLNMIETDTGLLHHLEYQTDLVDAALAGQLTHELEQVTAAAAQDPHRTVAWLLADLDAAEADRRRAADLARTDQHRTQLARGRRRTLVVPGTTTQT